MRRAVAMLVAFLLAGCLGGGGTPEPTPDVTAPTTPTGPTEPQAPRPQWKLGQGWEYAIEVPGQPTRKFEMMVAQDHGDLWVVASSDRAQAMHHAIYSTNPVLGRISKETLSPFQAGGPVGMYDFPLGDGKSWSSAFFGQTMTFSAAFQAIDVRPSLGLGNFVEGFAIEARGNSGARVVFDFVEGAGWFTSFEVLDEAGERQIKLTLVRIIKAYKGPYAFFRGGDAFDEPLTLSHQAGSGLAQGTYPGTVPDDRSDLVALGVLYEGRPGEVPPSLNISLTDPNGAERWSRDFSAATQVATVVDVRGLSGTWTIDTRMLGNLDVELRLVGMLIFAEGAL